MFTRKGFILFCVTAWLVMDTKVKAQEFPAMIEQPKRLLSRPLFASDTTTTRSNGLNVTASTTKTASVSTSAVVSESSGTSITTNTTMATSHSTGNDKGISGSSGLPLGLNEVLLIVGLCIGIPLIIVIVALAVVIARLKKQLRQALLWLKANQTASSKNGMQQPAVGDKEELSIVTAEPYQSLKPRKEIVSDGFYQSLNQSKKTDSAITSSDI